MSLATMVEPPRVQIFIPDTLQPLLRQRATSSSSSHTLNVIGFTQRQGSSIPRSSSTSSHDPDADPELPSLIQVSIVALSTSSTSSTHAEPCGYHDDEIVGQILTGDECLRRPPSWTFTSLPSIFITLRHSHSYSLRVERVVLDGAVLAPSPDSLLLFHYSPWTLNQAHYLRHLGESESGLPSILRTSFRPLPREREDIIPLQGEEWPPDEVAKDPFGEFRGVGVEVEQEEDEYEEGPPPTPTGSRRNSYTGLGDSGNPKSLWGPWSKSQLRAKVIKRSMGLKQLLFRFELLSNLFAGKLSKLGASNLVVLLLLDLTLGLILSHFLSTFPHLYSTLHAQIHHLLRVLLGLLNWLKGSPAGLKLNAALNSLLWRFFSYHLHLWANYIGILEPILSLILSTIIWVGVLGFTIQLSLMKDLLSMATFHVYCLYIYATRLYRVLTMAIKSLGRLFLGRKWNPLRNRVDHVHLSISETFLGALFFTIALFLAPTIIIYYAVFLSLRLPVLLMEWVLGWVVAIFNSSRPVTTSLILLNSPRVCDQVWLEAVQKGGDGVPSQFRIRLQATKPACVLPPHPFAIVSTLFAIFQGQVINK